MSSTAAALVGKSKDLVCEILSRLPLSSVIRFRFVCKEWHSLVSTQSFIDMHENNNQTPPCFVVQYFNYNSSIDYSRDCTTSISDHFNTLFLKLDNCNFNNNNRINMNSVREYINLSSNFSLRGGEEEEEGKIYYQQQRTNYFHKKTYYHIKLISSFRGFLIFTAKPAAANMSMSERLRRWLTKDVEEEQDPALILYNPVRKEKHIVTAPSSSHVYCGFYYHSPTKEHRILYLLNFDPLEARVVKFLVFCLQTKSTRVLKFKVNNIDSNSKDAAYYYHPDSSTPPVISNGSLHWVVSEDNHSRLENPRCSRSILFFGIESEEFHTMPHPPLSHTCNMGRRHKMNFLEMEGGTLCLCDGYGSVFNQLDIYVMEDYRKWTWIRRYRIDLCRYIGYSSGTNRCGTSYKALQILQGDRLLLLHFYLPFEKYKEYGLYSLNEIVDGRPLYLVPCIRTTVRKCNKMVRKSNNINKKKRLPFQVMIDGFGGFERYGYKKGEEYGKLMTRIRIKSNKKMRAPLVGGNMVVLTPSLASFLHSGSAPPGISTFFSIRTNSSYEYI